MKEDSHPVIITYHSIGKGDTPLHISTTLFAKQMEWLKAHANVVLLGAVVKALAAGVGFPERAAVLTFDDGFLDFAENAAPVLRRLGLPATVFLPTAFCGLANDWPGQPKWVEPQPLMDWPQIRELAAQGISFGAHTRSHCVLTGVSAAQAEEEILSSRRDIEERANTPVTHFCYPYGMWNAAIRATVTRHYEGACSTAAGIVERGADPFALPRVDAHYLRKPAVFRSMFTRRFRAYVSGRRWIRRLRGAPEGNYARLERGS
jgi:peptidoglycan/xylan/chitin deacetylase (PgdA/CDA1 family)